MSQITQAIRDHHRELATQMKQTADRATDRAGKDDLEAFVAFLRNDLFPHAQGEEKGLYPAVDPIIAAHERPTATMSIDHEHIERYIQAIGVAAARVANASEPDRATAKASLRDLVLQLRAIFELHLEKEERVYLPAVDRFMPAETQRKLLEEIHENAEAASAGERELDVRDVAPRERHPLIFRTFESLGGGDAFVLVNDHDPKPLYYQFAAEHAGEFTWTYLEQGPTWRVRIGRAEPAKATA